MPLKKLLVYAIGLLLLLVVVASLGGVIGFHYPRVIENQPLNHPVKVIRCEGNGIYLEDGRIIQCSDCPAEQMNRQLAQSDFMIDIERDTGDWVRIYARQDGWICGTPWAQPIRIPIIPQTVYCNRRVLIGFGTITQRRDSTKSEK